VPYTSPAAVPYRPFCSRRCKLIDLGRWLNEEYRITEEPPDLAGNQNQQRAAEGDLTTGEESASG